MAEAQAEKKAETEETAASSEPELQISIRMSAGALYDYMLHHAYTSAAGILGTCFGALGLLLYVQTRSVLYLVLGLVLLFYLPVTLYHKAWMQMKLNTVFQKPLDYRFTAEGITVAQGEKEQSLDWAQCVKAVSTGKSIILYTGKANASIFPRRELGGDAAALVAVLARHMEPKRMRVRF